MLQTGPCQFQTASLLTSFNLPYNEAAQRVEHDSSVLQELRLSDNLRFLIHTYGAIVQIIFYSKDSGVCTQQKETPQTCLLSLLKSGKINMHLDNYF